MIKNTIMMPVRVGHGMKPNIHDANNKRVCTCRTWDEARFIANAMNIYHERLQDHMLTIAEASAVRNISKRRLQTLVKEGRIPGAVKVGIQIMLPLGFVVEPARSGPPLTF